MNENKIDYSKLTIQQADAAKYTFSKPPSNIIFYDTSTGNQREVMRITKDGVTSNPDVPVDEGAQAIICALDGYIKNLVKEALAKQEQEYPFGVYSTEDLNNAWKSGYDNCKAQAVWTLEDVKNAWKRGYASAKKECRAKEAREKL